MNKRTLNSIYKVLHDELSERDADKAMHSIILIVPLKKGHYDREEILEAIARDRGESVAEVRKSLKGYSPAVLLRAENIVEGYYAFDADLALYDGGESYEQSSHQVIARPDSLRLSDGAFVDQYAEVHRDPRKALMDALEKYL